MNIGIEQPKICDALYASISTCAGPRGIVGSSFVWAYNPVGIQRYSVVAVTSILRERADILPSLVQAEIDRLSQEIRVRYSILGALVEDGESIVLCAKHGLRATILTSEARKLDLKELSLRALVYADRVRMTQRTYTAARTKGIDAILDLSLQDESDPSLRAFLYGILAGFVAEMRELPRPPLMHESFRFWAG